MDLNVICRFGWVVVLSGLFLFGGSCLFGLVVWDSRMGWSCFGVGGFVLIGLWCVMRL